MKYTAQRKEKYYVINLTAFIKMYTDFRWNHWAYFHDGVYHIGGSFYYPW